MVFFAGKPPRSVAIATIFSPLMPRLEHMISGGMASFPFVITKSNSIGPFAINCRSFLEIFILIDDVGGSLKNSARKRCAKKPTRSQAIERAEAMRNLVQLAREL